jgi:hypothetical protein
MSQQYFFGKLNVDHKGECTVLNKRNVEQAIIKFHPLEMFTSKSKRGEVVGVVQTADSKNIY